MGPASWKLAPLKNTVYSLKPVRALLRAPNQRYLNFLAATDSPDAGLEAIDKVAKPTKRHERSYRGFNLFLGEDHRPFLILARAQWTISGLRAADLRAHIAGLSPSRSSHQLERLRRWMSISSRSSLTRLRAPFFA